MKIICKLFYVSDVKNTIKTEYIRHDVLQILTSKLRTQFYHQDYNSSFLDLDSAEKDLEELRITIGKRWRKWK